MKFNNLILVSLFQFSLIGSVLSLGAKIRKFKLKKPSAA